MGDARATACNEMIRRQSPDGVVVDPHKRCLHSGDGAVNQDIGHFAPLNPPKQIQATDRLGGSNDEPIHLPGQQGIGLTSFQFGIFIEIRNDHVIAVWSHRLRNHPGNLGEERMGEFWQQQADGVGAPRHEAARHPIHLVMQFLRAPQHTLAGGCADPALVS